jgi:sugar lactone lactonase YvrE
MVRILTAAAFFAFATPALAVEDCPNTQPAKPLLSGQGVLESVIGGPDHKLYFTDTDKKALMRLDAPGAQPAVLSDNITAPGGLLVGLDGRSIIQGYGDGFQQGAAGNLVGLAGLLRIDLATGKQTTVATGTSMSNGLARDPAGAIYASSDAGTGIDRVVGDQVQRGWAQVVSGNGLAVSGNGRFLFVNQTFQPAAIQRIDLTDPQTVEQYAAPGPEDIAAGLDGLTIDQADRLFAAANQGGEVWRVGTDGTICALARGLNRPSAVAFGPGGAFPVTSLYVVSFGGDLLEIPGVRKPPALGLSPAAHLRLRVRPRFLRAGKRARVRVIVRRGTVLEPRALVRIKRKRTHTGPRGRAYLRIRPRRAGFLKLIVRAAGVPTVRRKIRVLPARGDGPEAVTDPVR